MQRVLIFIDWYLPGYKAGGPVTSVANIVEQFREEYHFFILTTNQDYGETEPYRGIEPDRWIQRGENLSVFYSSPKNRGGKQLAAVASEIGCDTWYITGMYSWSLSILPVIWSKGKTNLRTIIAPRGMLSPHALGEKGLKKQLFLQLVKWSGFYKKIIFQATNSNEAEDIRKIFPKNRIILAPNLPKPLPEEPVHIPTKIVGEVHFVSIGRISPEKNTLGAVEFLYKYGTSSLYSAESKIRFLLYGQIKNDGYWGRCEEVIGKLPPNIRVTHAGTIAPENLSQAITEEHFLLLPTMGENFGHAIIETLSLGRPVIISDRTPWKDLVKSNAGWELPLNDSEGFIEVLHMCVEMDSSRYGNMCEASRDYARRVINESVAIEAHKRIFAK